MNEDEKYRAALAFIEGRISVHFNHGVEFTKAEYNKLWKEVHKNYGIKPVSKQLQKEIGL